jgi:hypothetical protein
MRGGGKHGLGLAGFRAARECGQDLRRRRLCPRVSRGFRKPHVQHLGIVQRHHAVRCGCPASPVLRPGSRKFDNHPEPFLPHPCSSGGTSGAAARRARVRRGLDGAPQRPPLDGPRPGRPQGACRWPQPPPRQEPSSSTQAGETIGPIPANPPCGQVLAIGRASSMFATPLTPYMSNASCAATNGPSAGLPGRRRSRPCRQSEGAGLLPAGDLIALPG